MIDDELESKVGEFVQFASAYSGRQEVTHEILKSAEESLLQLITILLQILKFRINSNL